jgi:hypothetical protein
VRTAAVEIKTLTVSGKQVTLAVFRQLVQEELAESLLHLLPPEFSSPLYPGDVHQFYFRDTLWEYVNYHPDTKCRDMGNHLRTDGGLQLPYERPGPEPGGLQRS